MAADRERWKAAEAKRKAAEEDARRAAAAAANAGPSNSELNAARAAWKAAVNRKIKGNWNKPGERFGMSATIRLGISPSGGIRRFTLSCDGSTAFCESIKAAVHRSDPFPRPEYKELYNDTHVITMD